MFVVLRKFKNFNSPVHRLRLRVLHPKVEPLRVPVRVHVRPQVQLVVRRRNLDRPAQVPALEARLEDQIVRLERVRVGRRLRLRSTDRRPAKLRNGNGNNGVIFGFATVW